MCAAPWTTWLNLAAIRLEQIPKCPGPASEPSMSDGPVGPGASTAVSAKGTAAGPSGVRKKMRDEDGQGFGTTPDNRNPQNQPVRRFLHLA